MKKYLLIICCVLFVACAPKSKADYMSKFDEFITDVSENYGTYDDGDWAKKEKKYKKFTGEWYYKFEKEFTLKDELMIKANQAKWAVYRNLDEVSSGIKEVLNSDEVREAKEGVKSYIENDLENDVRSIEKEAKQLTEEVVRGAQDLLDEVNESLNK